MGPSSNRPQEIEESRGEKPALIDLIRSACRQPPVEGLAVDQLHGAEDGLHLLARSPHPLFDQPEHPPELLPPGAKAGAIGQRVEGGPHVKQAGGPLERAHGERAGREEGADLVLGEPSGRRPAQELRPGLGRVLVEGPEDEGAAVATPEPEGPRLRRSAPLERGEPAGEALQVENRNADRRRPEVAVGPAQEEPVQAARPVAGAGGGDHRAFRRRRLQHAENQRSGDHGLPGRRKK
jgi:hypothetical protein